MQLTGDLAIRNFSPIDKVPRLHKNVELIQSKLNNFKASTDFVAPEGAKETGAYALNS